MLRSPSTTTRRRRSATAAAHFNFEAGPRSGRIRDTSGDAARLDQDTAQ